MVNKLILGLLLNVSLVMGQQSNTVYQLLFSNASSAPTVSANVTNIGQSTHLVYFTTSNAPAHTCSFAALTGSLQFSFDNVTYVDFSNIINTIPGSSQQNNVSPLLLKGIGAFPFVKARINSFDTTNCLVTANYVGTVQTSLVWGQGVSNYGDQTTNSTFTQWSNAPILVAGLGTSLRAFPVITCDQTLSVSLVGTTTKVLLSSLGAVPANTAMYVCAISITTTAATAVTLYLDTTGDSCNTIPTPQLGVFNVSGTYTLGSGLGSVIKSSNAATARDICGVATGVTSNLIITYVALPLPLLVPGQ